MKSVRCLSGLSGYQCRLRKNYADFDEFKRYSALFGLAKRLGYETACDAWRANPVIEFSLELSDYRRVPQKRKKCK